MNYQRSMSGPEPIEIDPRDRALLEQIGSLRVQAWASAGKAFGSVLDRSAQRITILELDLATLADAPDTFRNR